MNILKFKVKVILKLNLSLCCIYSTNLKEQLLIHLIQNRHLNPSSSKFWSKFRHVQRETLPNKIIFKTSISSYDTFSEAWHIQLKTTGKSELDNNFSCPFFNFLMIENYTDKIY